MNHAAIEDKPLLAFLPLIYVAWADGELSAEGLEGISRVIEGHEGLKASCRARLARWLRPEAPPTARELEAMLRTIRRVGAGLPDRRNRGRRE